MNLLAKILRAKDERKAKIELYLSLQPAVFVISVKLNIPGPDKILKDYLALLDIACKELDLQLKEAGLEIDKFEKIKSAAGYEAIFLIQLNDTKELKQKSCRVLADFQLPKNNYLQECLNIEKLKSRENLARMIKILLINLEEKDPLGRLFDLDLWYTDTNFEKTQSPLIQLGRKDLGLADRKCLLCEASAFACARGEKHQLWQLIGKLQQMLAADQRFQTAMIEMEND